MITGSFLGFPVSREIGTSFIASDGHVLARTVAQDLYHLGQVNRCVAMGIGWVTTTREYREVKKIRPPFAPNGIIYCRKTVGKDAEGYAHAHELLTSPISSV